MSRKARGGSRSRIDRDIGRGLPVAALVQAGGTFMSTGGQPLDLPAGNNTLKLGIVRDPDRLFVVLIQAPPAPR